MTEVVKAIDEFVGAHQKDRMAGFVVFLAPNTETNRAKVRDLARRNKVSSIPLGMALEGEKGPPAYKLSPQAPITILVARGNKVLANFVLAGPVPTEPEDLSKEVAPIIEAAQKMLGPKEE